MMTDEEIIPWIGRNVIMSYVESYRIQMDLIQNWGLLLYHKRNGTWLVFDGLGPWPNAQGTPASHIAKIRLDHVNPRLEDEIRMRLAACSYYPENSNAWVASHNINDTIYKDGQ